MRSAQSLRDRADDRPPAAGDPDQPLRPTRLMERVSKALEKNESGLSKRALRAAVKGNNEHIDLAIELLIADAHITVTREGRSDVHRAARPYRESTDTTDAGEPEPEDGDDPWN